MMAALRYFVLCDVTARDVRKDRVLSKNCLHDCLDRLVFAFGLT